MPFISFLLNAIMATLARAMDHFEPDVNNQSFVDDVTLLFEDKGALQRALCILDTFLELTDQQLNVKKTYVFTINSGPFTLQFRDTNLPSKEVIKILGLKFRFANGKVDFRFYTEDLAFVEPACHMMKSANLPMKLRALLIG